MTSREVWIDKSLFDLTPSQAADWETWLKRHGMPSPGDIPLDNLLVCDDTARTVSVDAFRRDEKLEVMVDDHWEVLRDRVIVQLESPALPLPSGYGMANG